MVRQPSSFLRKRDKQQTLRAPRHPYLLLLTGRPNDWESMLTILQRRAIQGMGAGGKMDYRAPFRNR